MTKRIVLMIINYTIEYMSHGVTMYDEEDLHDQKIIGYQFTAPNSSSYKGSRYNVQVVLENGEITFEPLKLFAFDAPLECRRYAAENNLLDTPGWRQFRRI